MNLESENKIKIIYAEDSTSVAHLVKSMLINEGFDVTHFKNGEGVTNAVLSKMPEIVLLDKEMPVKDGMAVLEELKKLPETKDIPIIFFTTDKDQETVMKCLQLGVADYIVKDSNAMNNLIPRIRKHLK